jgi:hypothetical protein
MRGQKLQRNMVQGKAKVSPVPQPQGNEDGGPTEAPNDDRDQKVQAEMAKIQMEHEEYLSQRSIRETEIAIITSGLIFEDLLMSILNISLIWTAKDFEQFRAHPLFAMAAISTITSLLVLGLKIGEVKSWVQLERKNDKQEQLYASLQYAASNNRLSVLQNYTANRPS